MERKRRLKLLFLNPRSRLFDSTNRILKMLEDLPDFEEAFRWEYTCPSLALLLVASLFKDKHDIRYHDEEVDGEVDLDKTEADVLFCSLMTHNAGRGYELADKARGKGILSVAGGSHVSCLPDEALKHFDIVVVKEVESLKSELSSILDTLSAIGLRRLMEKIPLPLKLTGKTPDLSFSPVPAYELLDPSKIAFVPAQFTRGCPRKCTYCSVTLLYGDNIRKKKPEQAKKEIQEIARIFRGRNVKIYLSDENIALHPDYYSEIAETFRYEKINWACYSDISIAWQEKLLEKLRECGLRRILIGFETLEKLNSSQVGPWKTGNINKYGEAIKLIQEKGILVEALFMVGFDHDTEESFENLKKFVYEYLPGDIYISILTPLPGTAIFDEMKKQGRFLTEDWSKYTRWDVVFRPLHFTPEQLVEKVITFYREVVNSREYNLKVYTFFRDIYRRLL